MRAFALDAFGQEGTFRDVPKPTAKDGELLIRVKAAGVNTTDLAVMSGYMNDFVPHSFPLVPGIDVSGVVEAVGSGTDGWNVGDEVFGYNMRPAFGEGTWAEYVAAPMAGFCPKPARFGFAETAIVGHGSLTAIAAVEAAAPKAGDSVVLLGATGGVGSYAMQYLNKSRVDVVAVTMGEYENYARGMGADETIDYLSTDSVEAARKLRPEGYAAVIDLAGIPELLTGMSTLVNEGGAVASVVIPPDFEGLGARGVRGEFPNRFMVDGRLQEVTTKLESGELKFPALQIILFERIKEAIALQSTRHVRGKLALVMP